MKMKPCLLAALAAGLGLAATLLPPRDAHAEAGADDTLALLVTEVAGQQTKILDNQAKMDEKIAAITEELRVARIFVGRGGGKVP